MPPISERPILVTGADHSGSTWLGKMLAAAPSVGYIHEPFNPLCRAGKCAARFDTWLRYICESNKRPRWEDALRDTLAFRFNAKAGIKDVESPRDFLRWAKDGAKFLFYRLSRKRPLLKDPIALFSAEWLEDTFGLIPVVIIRHPLGYAGSRKKYELRHPFSDFLKQPELMRDHLAEFRPDIERFAHEEKTIVEQAALLWRLIHAVIRTYRQKHPDWIFVRHEDLCRAPLRGYRALYQKLGLRFTRRSRATIMRHASGSGGVLDDEKLKRRSAQVIYNWRDRLSPEEIDHVRENTAALAETFYPEEHWRGT